MIAFAVVSMTATFLLLGVWYVLFPRPKRPWWREPKRGDVIQMGRKRLW